MYGFYAINLLFVERNITRLIEYSDGPGGQILGSKAYMYALEGTTILLIIVVFFVQHLGRLRIEAHKYGRKGAEDGVAVAM